MTVIARSVLMLSPSFKGLRWVKGWKSLSSVQELNKKKPYFISFLWLLALEVEKYSWVLERAVKRKMILDTIRFLYPCIPSCPSFSITVAQAQASSSPLGWSSSLQLPSIVPAARPSFPNSDSVILGSCWHIRHSLAWLLHPGLCP